MPREESVSDLFKKLGNQAKKVHDKVIGKPVVVGNIQLPAGIEGGRAKLVDVKIGTFKEGDNKGKPFFMAQAMVLTPTHHNGIKCEGLRTSIGPEPLCDTPNSKGKRKTFEEHYDWALNALKMLGMPNDTDFDDVPDFIEAIMEEEPVILFRTWQGKPSKEFPDPKVQHEWNGLADSGEEVSVDEELNDESGDETFNEFPDEEGDSKPPKGKKTKPAEDDDDGLYPLAEKADKGDKAARKTLTAHALEHGLTKEEIEEAENWMTVVDKIRDAQTAESVGVEDEPDEDAESVEEAGEEEEQEEAEAAVPVNGEVWIYRPVDARTRKPGKPVEGIVSKVNLSKGTCNWKNMNTGKTLTDVPLKALIEVEE